MSELYLIAHRVRGEPAFDIAQKLQIGKEEGWIIPTSGHRAYPFAWRLLEEIAPWFDTYNHGIEALCEIENSDLSSWPDHYSINDSPLKPSIQKELSTDELLERIGL